jgi:magnesium-transporting ATPase (P-type)
MPARSNRHEPAFEPHKQPVEALFGQLACSRDGLSQAEAAERLRHEGPNLLSEVAGPSVARRLAKHLGHPFALLLWTGALLAFVAERFSGVSETKAILGSWS